LALRTRVQQVAGVCRKTVGLLLALSLIGTTAVAQKVWTLADCLAYASSHNAEVQQALLAQERSTVQVKAAQNAFLPTVEARMRTAGNWGFLIDPSTNELSNQFNFGNQAALNAALGVWDGGATAAQVHLRRQQAAAATYGTQARTNAVLLTVTSAYLQVLLTQEQVANATQRTAALTTQKRKVQAQVDKGVLSKRDLLAIQSQAAAEELLGVYADNSAEQALFDLRLVLGLPLQTVLRVQPVDVPDPGLLPDTPLAEVLAAPTPALPEYQAAQARVQAAQFASQVERDGKVKIDHAYQENRAAAKK
jgi:outer membrane protein